MTPPDTPFWPHPAGRVKQGSLTNEDVLRTEIPWPAFQNAGIISKEQLEMMYLLDKQTVEHQALQFESVRFPGRGGRGGEDFGVCSLGARRSALPACVRRRTALRSRI